MGVLLFYHLSYIPVECMKKAIQKVSILPSNMIP